MSPTNTSPGKVLETSIKIAPLAGTAPTVGTAILGSSHVKNFLSDRPLRRVSRRSLSDSNDIEDAQAARDALEESNERITYDDLRDELGLP